MQIGKLGDYSIYSWRGAVHGAKIEVQDKSSDSMNGSLYAWKNYRIQPSDLEFTMLTRAEAEAAMRNNLEHMQGTTQSLTRGNVGWIAKIIKIDIGPAIYTVSTIDNTDTMMVVKVMCECEKAGG